MRCRARGNSFYLNYRACEFPPKFSKLISLPSLCGAKLRKLWVVLYVFRKNAGQTDTAKLVPSREQGRIFNVAVEVCDLIAT